MKERQQLQLWLRKLGAYTFKVLGRLLQLGWRSPWRKVGPNFIDGPTREEGYLHR